MKPFNFTKEQRKEVDRIAKNFLGPLREGKRTKNIISNVYIEYQVVLESTELQLSDKELSELIVLRMIENRPCPICKGLPGLYKKKYGIICPKCLGTGLNRVTES